MGIIDLDEFIVYCVQNNIFKSTDTIKNVRISGQSYTGSSLLTIAYSFLYDLLVLTNSKNLGLVEEKFANFDLILTKMLVGEYVEVQVPTGFTLLSQIKTIYQVGPSDTSLKGTFEVRVGYSAGAWETPQGKFGFPLDPKRKIKYDVEFTPDLISASGDSMEFCWVLRIRPDYDPVTQTFTLANPSFKEVQICPYWKVVT